VKPGVAARVAAAENVHRVIDEGAHSNVLLDAADDRHGQARATIQRLTFDTLRWLPLIDFRIEAMSGRPVDSLDTEVANALRVALTELHLGGDAHGVVDSAVEAVRVLGRGRATGFVNAMCRRVTRGDVPEPLPADRDALNLGMPPWIWSRFVAVFGEESTDELVRSLNQPAAIGVRLRRDLDSPPGRPIPGIPSARLVETRREVTALGDDAIVMDPASTAVALAMDAKPGESMLDAAAAPGNKTSALWDAMGGDGLLIAADAHPRRVKRASRRMRGLGVGAQWVTADAGSPPFGDATFDGVLVDAPCTGLGTLRRRPEIKLRIEASVPNRMGAMQRALLESTIPLVRRGGRLVYAVCTFFEEETIDVVAGLGFRPPESLPGAHFGDGILLTPQTTQTDGMFIAVLDR